MLVHTACEALRSGHVLELIYDGYSRFVEVHDVGFTDDDNPIMRAWQVSGGIGNDEPVGWKILRLAEASEAVVTHQASLAPQRGLQARRPGHEGYHLPALSSSVGSDLSRWKKCDGEHGTPLRFWHFSDIKLEAGDVCFAG